MTFENLGLSQKALSGAKHAGYETPTPIQAKAIPVAVRGQDILGIAQTGTGKTASFVLPMLTRLEQGRARARMPRSLILEPTRELAAQVVEHFEALGREHKLTVALLIGGVSYDEQDRKLDRGADVLIATPGRLLDHFERGKLLLNGVEILVIDEADRMLDMGFIPDIERISKLIPPRRQTLFFSATMPGEIKRLADRFLKNPEQIEATPPSTTAELIEQKLAFAPSDPKGKRAVLRELLKSQNIRNAIVFCNRKRDVAIIHKSLVRHGFDAAALHGDMDQHQRTATLEAFRKGDFTILAASDVAARGLDIPAVSHIFNYDVPYQPEDYVHRIGRTGRAGKEGFAAMLVTAEDIKAVRAIERLVRREIGWFGDAPSEETLSGGRGRGGQSRRRSEHGRHGRGGKPKPRDRSEQSRRKPAAKEAGRAASGGSQGKESGTASRPPGKAGRRRGGKQASSKKKPGGKVRGMGDHMPAFMTRPTRPGST